MLDGTLFDQRPLAFVERRRAAIAHYRAAVQYSERNALLRAWSCNRIALSADAVRVRPSAQRGACFGRFPCPSGEVLRLDSGLAQANFGPVPGGRLPAGDGYA